MSYLNNLLEKVNLIARELMREFIAFSFELTVKPVIVPGIGHKFTESLDEQLQIGIKANHLVIDDSHIKSLQISNHKTNMQNSS